VSHAGASLWLPTRPATPIGEMRNWHLEIHCGGCRRHVALQVGHLAELYGEKTRIGRVIERLRCSGFQRGEEFQAKPRQVTLVEVSGQGKSLRKVHGPRALLPKITDAGP
jgi:hypothetical protein